MKLFLSSMTISYEQRKAFMDLVGKENATDIDIALIENAADVYEENKKDWMYENRDSITAHGFKVDLVDLEDYRQDEKGLAQRLKKADVIWLGGGNAYYLRWLLGETRADIVIISLVKEGKVYGGGSAGAILAGPTLRYFEPADSPEKAPELITEGLMLTKTVVVPHWGNEKYGHIMKDINKNLLAAGFKTVNISDNQALVIDGISQVVIPQ